MSQFPKHQLRKDTLHTHQPCRMDTHTHTHVSTRRDHRSLSKVWKQQLLVNLRNWSCKEKKKKKRNPSAWMRKKKKKKSLLEAQPVKLEILLEQGWVFLFCFFLSNFCSTDKKFYLLYCSSDTSKKTKTKTKRICKNKCCLSICWGDGEKNKKTQNPGLKPSLLQKGSS